MNFTKRAAFASVAVVCASLTFASAANAADASVTDCVHMAKQVATAISSAQADKVTNDVKAQARFGRDYCSVSMYAQGVEHYSKALQLLGKG